MLKDLIKVQLLNPVNSPTDPFTISAAVPGFLSLSSVDDGESFSVQVRDGLNFEIRKGCIFTYSSNTLSRGTLIASLTLKCTHFSSTLLRHKR